jgi:hypothetical protein
MNKKIRQVNSNVAEEFSKQVPIFPILNAKKMPKNKNAKKQKCQKTKILILLNKNPGGSNPYSKTQKKQKKTNTNLTNSRKQKKPIPKLSFYTRNFFGWAPPDTLSCSTKLSIPIENIINVENYLSTFAEMIECCISDSENYNGHIHYKNHNFSNLVTM